MQKHAVLSALASSLAFTALPCATFAQGAPPTTKAFERGPASQGPRWKASTSGLTTASTGMPAKMRPPTNPLVRGPGWMSPAAKKCSGLVYVSSYRLGYVAIYCQGRYNPVPVGQITDGISGPEGANVDGHGNFYVTNTTANTVTEYTRGSIHPSFTYSAGLSAPAGVAVDSKGDVFVSNLSPGSVSEFAQQSNVPVLTITDVYFPIDVAVDGDDNLYVTYDNASFSAGQINVYAPGVTQGKTLRFTTKSAGGIALDLLGDIVTADQGNQIVDIFRPRAAVLPSTFGRTLDPDPVRLNRAEQLVYVGDPVENAVYVYAYPSGNLTNTITDGVDGPNGVALDPTPPL